MSKEQTIKASQARTANSKKQMLKELKAEYDVFSIEDVLLMLSYGMAEIVQKMQTSTEIEIADLCKMQNSVVQSSLAIARIKEVGQFEARLVELEKSYKIQNGEDDAKSSYAKN